MEPEFWYSRKQALLFIASLFILARIVGSLTPPFQSLDEFDHIKHVYLLSHGVVAIDSRTSHTGAAIDEGLLGYMDCFERFPYDYGAKVNRSIIRACGEIHYTGKRKFSELGDSARYFPLVYVPQAVALFLGERFNLSVSNSYDLARLFSLCATLALLLWALLIYPMPPAALALFLMPVCLFQLGSASLDAMMFSTTTLTASLFLRGCRREAPFGATLHIVLTVCLMLLATSQVLYLALTPLLLVLYRVRKSPAYVISFAVVLVLSVAWIPFALMGNGRGLIAQEVSFFSDALTVRGHWHMFIGVLGWLDTPMTPLAYLVLTIELLAILAISNFGVHFRSLNVGHLVLMCTAGVMLLVRLIGTVQTRDIYPIVPLVLFGCWTGYRSGREMSLSYAILTLTSVSSVQFVVPGLLARYY